jgi:hypothetical protein
VERFLYLFRNDPEAQKSLSPGQMEQRLKKTLEWIESLRRKGHLEGGERLESAGKVIRSASQAVSDGPYVETKDIIGGYLLIAARDLDQAVELARDCPIPDTGGSVEIRPLIRA